MAGIFTYDQLKERLRERNGGETLFELLNRIQKSAANNENEILANIEYL